MALGDAGGGPCALIRPETTGSGTGRARAVQNDERHEHQDAGRGAGGHELRDRLRAADPAHPAPHDPPADLPAL